MRVARTRCEPTRNWLDDVRSLCGAISIDETRSFDRRCRIKRGRKGKRKRKKKLWVGGNTGTVISIHYSDNKRKEEDKTLRGKVKIRVAADRMIHEIVIVDTYTMLLL